MPRNRPNPYGSAQIRALMQRLGWDRYQLAAHLGISKRTIDAWCIDRQHPDGASVVALMGLERRKGRAA